MDTIADFLTIIRNGYLARKDSVTTNVSKTRLEVARILKEEGFITGFETKTNKPSDKITLELRYLEDIPAITGIKRVSRPSVRIYKKATNIPRTLSGAGLTIVSTPQGLMSGRTARQKNLGGEVICQVW